MEKKYGLRCVNVFHAGDGNLHPLILYDANVPGELERTEAFGAEILELTVELGGTITGEHGVGYEKIGSMCVQFSTATSWRLSTASRRPSIRKGLLNPGKAVPTLHRCAEFGRMHVHHGAAEAPRTGALLMIDDLQGSASLPAQPLCIRGAGSKDFYGNAPHGRDSRYARPRRHRRLRADRTVHHRPVRYAAGGNRGRAGGAGAVPGLRAAALFADSTIGGVVAAGLSGPRRASAGSLRDFVLGVKLLDGAARELTFGGQVMKNVAGYDVSRVIAGSLGTLGLILEVSLKVLPQPVAEATLRFEMAQAEALDKLNRWAGQPLPIVASAWARRRADAAAGRRAGGGGAASKTAGEKVGAGGTASMAVLG